MSVDVTSWRGMAQDEDAERTAAEGSDESSTLRLRRSSRALLGDLMRSHRRPLTIAILLLLLQNAAAMAGPYLVMVGIGKGMTTYLRGLPEELYALFGTGYLGYTAARTWGKVKGVEK